MAVNGPIILVEDDTNDSEIIKKALREVGVANPVISFDSAKEAFTFLTETQERPFLILCDIRMPSVDGLSFRKNIMAHEALRKKSIPFIFFTAMVSPDIVNEAYEMEVQGFYKKATSFPAIKEQLLTICLYWKQCLHPNAAVAV